MVTKPALCLYEFGGFRLDVGKRLLLRGGEVVALTPKCFDILLVLVESKGELLSKDELMQRVWPDSFVEESNLTYNISTLRKALGEKATSHQYIVTVPGIGYRFTAEVREVNGSTDEPVSIALSAPLPIQRNVKGKVVIGAVLLILFSGSLIYWLARKSSSTIYPPSPIQSIAVLPFKRLGSDASSDRCGRSAASCPSAALARPTGRLRQRRRETRGIRAASCASHG